MIAAIRPDSWNFPLFLHVFGAIILFGSTLAAVTLSFAGWRAPTLSRSAFWTLLAGALPSWLLMRAGGQWIYSKEGFSGDNDPTWLGIGYLVGDFGLLILLLATGFAFWWKRSRKLAPARVVAVLSTLYLVMLVVAWLAMSGKWG
jgi:phosphoglycerol transferase MdoB-like AlkP superfamily enzyme